jgi:anthranilate synthase component I
MNIDAQLASLVEDFSKVSPHFDVVPIAVELHVEGLSPLELATRLTSDGGFLLESVEDGARFGRYSFVGCSSLGYYCADAMESHATGVLQQYEGRTALDTTEAALRDFSVSPVVGATVTDLPLVTGLVGVYGWDVVREIETLPPRVTMGAGHPTAVMDYVGDLVAFDHWRQSCTLVVNVATKNRDTGDAWREVESRFSKLVAALFAPATPHVRGFRGRQDFPLAPAERTVSSEHFQLLVAAAKEHIAAGDVFQIVLSQRFDVGEVSDALAVYRVLRQMNPSAYLYFLRFPDCVVVGSSPEALVRVRDGRATTRPIAGSRPRSSNDGENAVRAAALREDPKEVAEHIMLVDLGRNDIGRVATYGSVQVDELMTVEHYSHIMHLTSQVSGEVRDGLGPVDVLRATFPAGTLSGAPKVRAMELITEMEPEERGLYGGAVGYFDSRGNFDAAILIRTLVISANGTGSVQTGAGIVWDSDPKAEDEECLAKAEAILRAVGGARS